jgi:hypothetical protein
MRLAIASLLAAASFSLIACSGGAEPGSPEWCKNTPQDKQIEEPAGMAQCFERATQ